MFNLFTRGCAIGVFALVALPAASTQGFEPKSLTIASGGFRGAYYPGANSICQHLNQTEPRLNFRCTVTPSEGTIRNLILVQNGRTALGIAQSDVLYNAVNDPKSVDEYVGFDKIRHLFALHPEQFVVVARRGSGIQKLTDILGKKLSVGDDYSGTRSTIGEILAAAGLNESAFETTIGFSTTFYRDALCEGKVDVVLNVGANPQNAITDAIQDCGGYLVPIEGPKVDSIIASKPQYSTAEIPVGTYPNMAKNIKTFGVAAVLVVSADMDENTAYQIVRRVFEQRERFTSRHKLASQYSVQQAATLGNTAPYHPGALRYYREAGIAISQ
jgi:TRAP transporter TAXI family solute receptor